jgi:hypothetical protein
MHGKLDAETVRATLEEVEPELLTLADALRERFGSGITAISVPGRFSVRWEEWERLKEQTLPYHRYPRPGEVAAEWERIKEAIEAGDAAQRRAGWTGRAVRRGAPVSRRKKVAL